MCCVPLVSPCGGARRRDEGVRGAAVCLRLYRCSASGSKLYCVCEERRSCPSRGEPTNPGAGAGCPWPTPDQEGGIRGGKIERASLLSSPLPRLLPFSFSPSPFLWHPFLFFLPYFPHCSFFPLPLPPSPSLQLPLPLLSSCVLFFSVLISLSLLPLSFTFLFFPPFPLFAFPPLLCCFSSCRENQQALPN